MREWRIARPRATFAELQAAVDDRLDQLRARLLQEIALASQAVAGAEVASHMAIRADINDQLKYQ